MQFVEMIERTHESLMVLGGPGPRVAHYWDDYRQFIPMLSEKHSTALYMADQAARRGERNKKYETDVSQETIDAFVISASTILRKIDKDIQSVLGTGGNDAILYLKTLTTLRESLTGTIEHFTRLIGT